MRTYITYGGPENSKSTNDCSHYARKIRAKNAITSRTKFLSHSNNIYIYTHIYIYKIYISFFLTFLKFNFIFIFAQQEISIVPFARSLVRRSFVLSVLLCSELTKQNVHTNHSIVCFFL